ncbi:hypothetical protein LTR78_003465 [Recurvomyces mirabilis]|uniref:Uncharacterized protein n=1 Tax=Recurvomyces mirabilis TaxID=574656 RepID=A0AAE0WS93_9PEZI|nr:hypothetical protein LTR78_003465 [Recurvomyces mirabilis]KAK5154502.1 hypothetical protein LTS14_006638 [Recurvomyces mirabilis]
MACHLPNEAAESAVSTFNRSCEHWSSDQQYAVTRYKEMTQLSRGTNAKDLLSSQPLKQMLQPLSIISFVDRVSHVGVRVEDLSDEYSGEQVHGVTEDDGPSTHITLTRQIGVTDSIEATLLHDANHGYISHNCCGNSDDEECNIAARSQLGPTEYGRAFDKLAEAIEHVWCPNVGIYKLVVGRRSDEQDSERQVSPIDSEIPEDWGLGLPTFGLKGADT